MTLGVGLIGAGWIGSVQSGAPVRLADLEGPGTG